MRLLFIYFYHEKGTFKKDTIIAFSKKYSIEQDKDKKFKFKLTKNKEYDNKFYSNNGDIGVIIGENGTGKSILVNSIRDETNNYSITVYENNEEVFLYVGEKQEVIINEISVKNERNFEYIYYSPIFDIFENEIDDKYNISNIALHQKFEKGRDENFCMSACSRDRLNIIEHEDLKKYFNYNRTKDEKVNINVLKVSPSSRFFDKFEKDILTYSEVLFDNVFDIEISQSNLNIEFYKHIIDNLSNGKITKIINQLFNLNTDIYHEITDNNSKLSLFLSRDYKICKEYFIHLDRFVIKQQIIKKEVYQFEQYIKDSYTNNINRFNERFILSDISMYLEKTMNIFIDKDLIINITKYKEKVFNDFFEMIEQEVYHHLNRLSDVNMDDYFVQYLSSIDRQEQQKIFYYLEGNQNFSLYLRYIYLNIVIDIIENKILDIINKNYGEDELRYYVGKREFTLIHKTVRELINHSIILTKIKIFYVEFKVTKLTFNKRYYSNILLKSIEYKLFDNIYHLYEHIDRKEKKVEKFYKDYIPALINNQNIDGELKKTLFIIHFKDIYNALDNSFEKLNVMIGLIKIFILDYDTSKYSLYLSRQKSYDLEYINKLFQLEDYDELFQDIQKSRTSFIEVNDTFFKYSRLLIEKNLDALHYAIYPPLSSGQKTILFIFARIDDAIKRISQESKNKNILILLDEADLTLHLEWQRKFIHDLIEFLNMHSNKTFYILYATHSPMILSDITDDRVVFLKNDGVNSKDIYATDDNKKRTFGANIYDLYHDSFFMDQFMGEFAQNKINEIINIINLSKIIDEIHTSKSQIKEDNQKEIRDFLNRYDLHKLFNSYYKRYDIKNIIEENMWLEEFDNIQKESIRTKKYLNTIKKNILDDKESIFNIVSLIGEPLLRNQLLEELKSIGNIDKTKDIVNRLNGLNHNEIEDELSKYDREMQINIWKELFKIKGDNNHGKS